MRTIDNTFGLDEFTPAGLWLYALDCFERAIDQHDEGFERDAMLTEHTARSLVCDAKHYKSLAEIASL